LTVGIKDLFRSAPSMNGAQAREYLAGHRGDTFTLLDVRQPKEYREQHIPGSHLIPLPQLSERMSELPLDRPTIVYCAIGGRSEVAARFLASRGFQEVYNLAGGIKAWRGETVASPVGWHLPLLEANGGFERLARLARQLEEGLGRLYADLAERAEDKKVAALLTELAGWEVGHEKRVTELAVQAGVPESALEVEATARVIEGGFDPEAFVADNAEQLGSRRGILELAMMVEAHALDLYLLFAQAVKDEAARSLLYAVADEEKGHLARLGLLMEETA
jgi:sulfur-carrier protein adenylyltransferase/sulfurtransferase